MSWIRNTAYEQFLFTFFGVGNKKPAKKLHKTPLKSEKIQTFLHEKDAIDLTIRTLCM
jgi:hypothetical protein